MFLPLIALLAIFLQVLYRITKSQALRQAQLSLLRREKAVAEKEKDRATISIVQSSVNTRHTETDFAHPFYWAAFVLTGNSL